MVLGLLLNRGDWVLTEEYTYPHMVDSITGPHGYQLWGVPYDKDGIIPLEMEKVCILPASSCCAMSSVVPWLTLC